ncbi:MAG TPA: M20/M25/M40 family metallo-hydrolase [Pyrinomonadaceae bacterium]|nr:M20/M25/M40 family metallo-hydrolase [Pyrinomonadaceae bacterium]
MFRRNAAAALLIFATLSQSLALAQQTTPAQKTTPTQQPTPSQQPTPTVAQPAAQTPTPQPAQPAQAQPTPTPDIIERIKDEELNRSQLMQTLEYLTDVIGPRLTGSPALRRANDWTKDRLASWGLSNAHLEGWPFGRGWTLKRFSAEVVEPQAFPLLAYPRAWSPGLDAPLTADVVVVDAKNERELEKYKGQLKGKIVLAGSIRDLKPHFDPVAKRLSDKELLELADAPDPANVTPRPRTPPTLEQIAEARFNARKTQFYYDEGVALIVAPSPAGDGGDLQFVQSASVPQAPDVPFNRRVQPWQREAPKLIPQIAVSNDHFNRLARMIRQGVPVRMSVNLQAEFADSDPQSYNTVAEIPGTDLKDEVVMLGAHLDSWHTATGATDNGVGVAIMMEAARILKALGVQPRRTIRVALWSGEEEGLLGSRAYVREHFGPVAANAASANAPAQTPPSTSQTQTPPPAASQTQPSSTPSPQSSATQAPQFKPEYEKLSVYYNVDSGTGAIRGVFLQGNEALRPVFRRWLEPFREIKVGPNTYNASTVTVSNSEGSDFLSFDAVGLNGIDFLQDEIEYEPRTWHTNQDNFDRVIPEDAEEAAIIVAAFVYNSAMADAKLPRKPFKAPGR